MHFARTAIGTLCRRPGAATDDTTLVTCPACVAIFHAVAKLSSGKAGGDVYGVALLDHTAECPLCRQIQAARKAIVRAVTVQEHAAATDALMAADTCDTADLLFSYMPAGPPQ